MATKINVPELTRQAYGVAYEAEALRRDIQRAATETPAHDEPALAALADAYEAMERAEKSIRAATGKLITLKK